MTDWLTEPQRQLLARLERRQGPLEVRGAKLGVAKRLEVIGLVKVSYWFQAGLLNRGWWMAEITENGHEALR